eukprot:TRINITY_DN74992_c0_g1_i1.p1 TRINITY_DN74992_c0_g1~~TRINITY_DN74992_c0_g1_i1.p1  ORF type:complete len:207 (-),score=46.78 TRINITY_DN74992_c0_g1_i1:90-710(-)
MAPRPSRLAATGRGLANLKRSRGVVALVVACAVSVAVRAASLVFASGLHGRTDIRRNLRVSSPMLRHATAAKTEGSEKPAEAEAEDGDEAAKTRALFMSLDSDEFGIDPEDLNKPAKPTEKSGFEKAGDKVAGPAGIITFLVIFLCATYYFFFTKAAEEEFYYGPQRERTERITKAGGSIEFQAALNMVKPSAYAPGEQPNEQTED